MPELTTEFKRWFGKSSVVSEDGEPLVVFHGTKANFREFKERDRGREFGFHFGTIAAAEQRLLDTTRTRCAGHIIAVHLSLQNPIRLDRDPGNFTALRLLQDVSEASKGTARLGFAPLDAKGPLERAGALTADQVKHLTRLMSEPDDYYERTVRCELRRLLEEAGYDGIAYPNSYEGHGAMSYVAFRPGQVKAVYGNNGRYDLRNPDMTDHRPLPLAVRKAQRAQVALSMVASLTPPQRPAHPPRAHQPSASHA